MRRQSPGLALLVVVVTLLQACATTSRAPSVLGRNVTVIPQADAPKVRGELLAVAEGSVIVRAEDGIHEMAIPQIREVRVQRHSFDGKKGWTWTIVGALVSSVGLAAACSSVEENGSGNCAAMGLIVGAAPWLLVGGLSARSLERSAFLSVDFREGERLRAFARYPQGLPTGFDLRGLERPPPAKR